MSDGENLAGLYNQVREATDVLHANATEVLQLTQRIERLTKDTPAWYPGTRAKAEARRRVRMSEEEELSRVLEELG